MGELKDKGVKGTVDHFLGQPVGPVKEVVDGREIWGHPCPSESAEDYMGALAAGDRFELFREMFDGKEPLSLDQLYELANSSSIHNIPNLVEAACAAVLADEAGRDEEVRTRYSEQREAFTAWEEGWFEDRVSETFPAK
jgi:hypothetical protein